MNRRCIGQAWRSIAAVCLLVVASCAPPLGQRSAGSVKIENGRLAHFELGGANRVPQGHDEPLWILELFDTRDHTTVAIKATDRTGKFRVEQRTGRRGIVHWQVFTGTGDQPVASLDTWVVGNNDSASFHLAIGPVDARYQVERVWYPCIPMLPLGDSPDDDSLLVPTAHGQDIVRIHKAPQRGMGRGSDVLQCVYRARYPSKYGNLQMQFYHDEAGGLLWMTPDPTRRIKDFVVDKSGAHLRGSVVHYPCAAEPLRRRKKLHYPVTVRWVDGDWYDAAQIYRCWALGQKWATRPGSFATRTDIPDWFRSLPSWVRIPRDPRVAWDEKTQWPLIWAKAVGTPMMVHWYGWDGLSARDWPRTLPPRKGFAELQREYCKHDIHITPYIDPRLACLDSPDWPKVEHDMLRNRKGKLEAVETWPAYATRAECEKAKAQGRRVHMRDTSRGFMGRIEHKFAVGCLSAPRWQEHILDWNRQLFFTHGVAGVYQDQNGVWAARCFATNHGHTPGDPTAWLDGMNDVYVRLRAELRKRRVKGILVSEYQNEGNMPHIHGGLTVSRGLTMKHRLVPLFQAVYHTHYASIGWSDNVGELSSNPEGYLHQRLLPLILGSHMGWVSYVMRDLVAKHPDIVASFRQGVDLRRRFGPMLGYGRLLRPPVVQGVPRRLGPAAGRGATKTEWPAVLAGFFRDGEDGRRALCVLANWTKRRQAGTVTLDLSELPKPLRARWVGGHAIGLLRHPSASIAFDLVPMTVQAILLEQGR